MKRLFYTILALSLSLGAWANETIINGIHYILDSSTSTAEVTYTGYLRSKSAYTGSITIPTSVTYNNITYSVTSIGDYAFYNSEGLTSITIPNSVLSIGDYAFYRSEKLTSITIPNSVTSIGKYAFSSCTGLTSVTIPNSVTSIGNHVFWGCTGLISVIISNSVTIISNYAFDGCTGLTSVTIPNSVISIGAHAFRDCTGLTSVTIPNSVTSIGDYAFWSCKGLTSVTIPNSVIVIGDYAFYGCTGLTNVTIPNSVTSINKGTFHSCTGLTSITIPNSVTSIGGYAFEQCTGLTSVTIPNSVIVIGNYAFYGCKGLTNVTIPNSVTNIGINAFDGCTGLTNIIIPNSVTSIGTSAFSDCTGLTSITIGNGVTSIGNNAFSGCNANIYLPDDITNIDIGTDAFYSDRVYVNRGSTTLLTLWKKKLEPYDKSTEEKLLAPFLSVESTQTTLKLKINNYYEEYNNEIKVFDRTITEYYLNNLCPNVSYSIYLYVSNDVLFYSYSTDAKTKSMNPRVTLSATASSIMATGSYTRGDATVISESILLNGKTIEGNKGQVLGLEPNQQYEVTYTVTVAYGEDGMYSKSFSNTRSIRTAAHGLTTQQPKVISAGNVIVQAMSNLNDEETNVGFEWRRTDWTDDFASNTGEAYLYEGVMEGYIRNLYTEKLWKYRPYYESNSGTRYYGEWVGIDPTNTSYFEPTVHTYAKIDVQGNAATVRGYAMRGSDNVRTQGFMYWKTSNDASRSGNMAHAMAQGVPNDALIVEATGIVMEAQLSDLDYESTYCCMAFVTTTEGETFYGEQQTFQTGQNPSGVDDVRLVEEPVEVARYDLRGRRIDSPQQGLNIIRMSDGTTRKVVIK